jgi:hypothetical protein
MPDRLSLHAPVLVNTLGHCAGAIVFGILLYFLSLDWRRERTRRGALPCVAAALALLWNLGSLIGLATAPGDSFSDGIVAASFSVLSLLPAVLLHISLGGRRTPLSIAGYIVGVLAVLLHIADLITDAPRFHYAAILLVTTGFGALAAIVLGLELSGRETPGSGKRLAGAMVLFVLAISFVHFRADHEVRGWSGEIALHHAALPLALFVLLQDYRFLLLDAFVRFLANAVLAALTVWAGLTIELHRAALPIDSRTPFSDALAFVAACALVGIFAFVRGRAQKLLTRVVFLRTGVERALSRVRDQASMCESPDEYLRDCSRIAGEVFAAARAEISPAPAGPSRQPRHAALLLDPSVASWVHVVAPLRFSRGDVCWLRLGSRAGGRRYLSEDMELLDRMAALIVEHVERMRSSEMQELVAQAELRALQAQINPHFFFNALNTLYGSIPRESAVARKLVLDLAELFRVSFAPERSAFRIEEELRLVRAYLQIEQLRLGPRLRTSIDVDDAALGVEIPVLSIQPLVENAIRHGVASRHAGGFVSLRISALREQVNVEVMNSGAFGGSDTQGSGVGLANVRRRLELCFGKSGGLKIESSDGLTTVSFSVPRKHALTAQTPS